MPHRPNGPTRWLQLERREKQATIAVACLVPAVSVSLWLLGFERTLRWIEQTANRREHEPGSESKTIGVWVDALTRLRHRAPWTGRCLAQALALWWVLRRNGVRTSLHLGVQLPGSDLVAHAWIVHNGRVLADKPDVAQQYEARFSSAPGTLSFGARATNQPNG